MRIIIDGYNVLKKMYHDELIDEQTKAHFLNQLHYYGKKKGHAIIVIFDGGLFSYPEREIHKSVTVIYAGARRTADDYIKEYVLFKKGELLLVSSDQQLCRELAEHEIVCLDAYIFYTFVQEALVLSKQPRSIERAHKTSQEHNSELDELMFQASETIKQKKEDRDDMLEQPEKMSKIERKLFNIIKKL